MEKELENIDHEETFVESTDMQDDNQELQVSTEAVGENIENEIAVKPADAVIVDIKETYQAKATKKVLQGKVVSNKPDKTVIIKVERQVSHPIYKKYYKKTKKFMAHDENNDCNIGDIIRIRESRPLSARKCWELVEIVERAK